MMTVRTFSLDIYPINFEWAYSLQLASNKFGFLWLNSFLGSELNVLLIKGVAALLFQAAHSKEINPIKPSLTSHKWLSLRTRCQHRAIAPVKLASGHLNAQLQPFIEASPLARLTAFFKGTNNLNNGVNIIWLNQDRVVIGVLNST